MQTELFIEYITNTKPKVFVMTLLSSNFYIPKKIDKNTYQLKDFDNKESFLIVAKQTSILGNKLIMASYTKNGQHIYQDLSSNQSLISQINVKKGELTIKLDSPLIKDNCISEKEIVYY